jgi:cytochrome c-type biogenesis protein CcmE
MKNEARRRMPVKPLHIFGLALIIGFGVYGATGMKDSITPYVSIAQARATQDRVQVKGALDKKSLHSDSLGRLIFQLKDFQTGQRFEVIFSGQHPANMQMARDVVAMGSWNASDRVFDADQMNIKCPDKYQPGVGTTPAT